MKKAFNRLLVTSVDFRSRKEGNDFAIVHYVNLTGSGSRIFNEPEIMKALKGSWVEGKIQKCNVKPYKVDFDDGEGERILTTKRIVILKGETLEQAAVASGYHLAMTYSKMTPSYLFFDTETTGLPRNWKAPVSDLDNWPRLVQIAWLLYDQNGQMLTEENYLIKPNGFTIPSEATEINGISTERAMREGEDLNTILRKFANMIEKSDYLIAHNISFDEKIVGAEFLREKMSNKLFKKDRICTMETSTDYCQIPGPYGYKWPKLSELHLKLFGADFEEAHNASVDIKVTAKCFWEMKKNGVI